MTIAAMLFTLTTTACASDDNNNGPALQTPLLKAPAAGATEVSLLPTFEWESSGSGALYDLEIKADGDEAWTMMAEEIVSLTYTLDEEQELDYATSYSWRVTASLGRATKSSRPLSFTTVDESAPPFGDGDSYLYLDSEKESPFIIVVTGDGFTAEDYESGLFDRQADEMMDLFFSFDPYKSYRDYIEVWKLVAHSNVSGITGVSRDTRFGSFIDGPKFINHKAGMDIESTSNIIYQFAMNNIPAVGLSNIDNVCVLVLCNADIEAGGCWRTSYQEGRAITLLGTGNNLGVINVHEAGHSIGRLGDEYGKLGIPPVPPGFPLPEPNPMPQNIVDLMVSNRAGDPWNHYPNLHPYNDRSTALWAKYYDLPLYNDDVDFYEGGNDWIKGCWRSTEFSIMNKGVEHASYGYNVISREAIVRRLLNAAGEPFDFATFLANDSNEVPNL